MKASLAIAAALLGASLPEVAHAEWLAMREGALCTQIRPPSPDLRTMVSLASDRTLPMVMLAVASPRLAQLPEGGGYAGLLRFGGLELPSPVAARNDGEINMVSMTLALEHLDALAAAPSVEMRVDGRRLIEIAPSGLPEAAAALRRCLAGEAPATQPAQPQARRTTPAGSVDAALAAAVEAGERAIREEAQAGPGEAASPSLAGMAAAQAQIDSTMMMFRMNNRLIGNGGDFSDPSLGPAMLGWE